MVRRRGFTVLELLVVVAIIGMLSAMLFPVFATARASARDSTCACNLKSIATAVRMYAADYGAYFPDEHDPRALDYFNSSPGRISVSGEGDCHRAKQANPYLRPAVLLTRYLRHREVWRCPQAKVMSRAAWIVPRGPGGDWLQAYVDHEGGWGHSGEGGPCYVAFPPGWGGAITDSFAQGLGDPRTILRHFSADPAFVQGLAVNDKLTGMRPSQIVRPSRFITCGDNGRALELWEMSGLAFPDTCAANGCGGQSCPAVCTHADWENCAWTTVCGVSPGALSRMFSDPSYRRQFTRHNGGSNVGFADGHVSWIAADYLLTHAEPYADQTLDGLCSCWPGNGVR
jgi:prepilin-type N-terminal cleavage/methylation domain-containing protein/prepilin-type processing-associated H-X9-DG protein